MRFKIAHRTDFPGLILASEEICNSQALSESK